MSAFHLHRGNRIERLVDELGALLREPRGTPFRQEPLIAHGRGMSLWLAHELSKRLGVWANEMPYPRHFVERLARTVLGEGALGTSPLSEDLLEWGVQARLDGLLETQPFAELKRYVEEDPRGLRRAQLASRIATVFDQYLVYRPAWVRAWEQGKAVGVPARHSWQPILWREVSALLSRPHIASVEAQMLQRLRELVPPEGLPPRVLLFGLSTLPPLYVRVLAALARHVDVHLFLYSPSPSTWHKRAAAAPARRLAASNALLSSMGFLGADFDTVLTQAFEGERVKIIEHDHHEAPNAETVLGRLQADLFEDLEASRAPRLRLPADASSIGVHSCHGPLREVEVLHDQLLSLAFRGENRVAPEEILVLCPALQEYAPLIDAVFARPYGTQQFLPYHVSDRPSHADSPVVDALGRVLSMVGGRVTATDVADLLVLDVVRQRFDLAATEVASIIEWIADSGVSWGVDGEHRGRHGVPATDDFSWRFALRRLLLGYAMASDGTAAFADIVPYDDIEGRDGQVLGVFARFVRALFAWLAELERPRPLSEWSEALVRLGEALLARDKASARQLARVRQGLEVAVAAAAEVGFREPVDIAVVRDLLSRKLDASNPARGFLSGGITFCAMVPMRSIPFRVVCVLGMNDGAFPRSPRPLEFDAIRNGMRREAGDRSPRDDDRYLFLETLGAARERLVITYSGQGIRDNEPRPASVCLGELLDALAERYEVASASEGETERRDAVRGRLVVRHRLQGFNPAYFDASERRDRRLFSHSEQYAAAARALRQARGEQRPFVDGELATECAAEIRLDDFVRFFRSPAAFFLNRRLGVYLSERGVEVDDREPLEVDELATWGLGESRVAHVLEGLDIDESERLLRGAGLLPLGHQGRLELEGVDLVATAVARRSLELRGAACRGVDRLPPQRVDVDLGGGRRIVGSIDGLWEGGFVEQSYSTMKPKRFLQTWVRHVVACAAGSQYFSSCVGRGGKKEPVAVFRWPPLGRQRAHDILRSLVELFEAGHTTALPFAPATSWKYVESLTGPDSAGTALEKAIHTYAEGRLCEMESDPHLERAFGAMIPPFVDLGDVGRIEATMFHRAAVGVFGPARDERVEGET